MDSVIEVVVNFLKSVEQTFILGKIDRCPECDSVCCAVAVSSFGFQVSSFSDPTKQTSANVKEIE